MEKTPWDDLKVAYGYANEDAFQSFIGNNWDCQGKLPQGWTLNELDASGARCVAVFRVEGPFRNEDAQTVANLLAQFQTS